MADNQRRKTRSMTAATNSPLQEYVPPKRTRRPRDPAATTTTPANGSQELVVETTTEEAPTASSDANTTTTADPPAATSSSSSQQQQQPQPPPPPQQQRESAESRSPGPVTPAAAPPAMWTAADFPEWDGHSSLQLLCVDLFTQATLELKGSVERPAAGSPPPVAPVTPAPLQPPVAATTADVVSSSPLSVLSSTPILPGHQFESGELILSPSERQLVLEHRARKAREAESRKRAAALMAADHDEEDHDDGGHKEPQQQHHQRADDGPRKRPRLFETFHGALTSTPPFDSPTPARSRHSDAAPASSSSARSWGSEASTSTGRSRDSEAVSSTGRFQDVEDSVLSSSARSQGSAASSSSVRSPDLEASASASSSSARSQGSEASTSSSSPTARLASRARQNALAETPSRWQNLRGSIGRVFSATSSLLRRSPATPTAVPRPMSASPEAALTPVPETPVPDTPAPVTPMAGPGASPLPIPTSAFQTRLGALVAQQRTEHDPLEDSGFYRQVHQLKRKRAAEERDENGSLEPSDRLDDRKRVRYGPEELLVHRRPRPARDARPTRSILRRPPPATSHAQPQRGFRVPSASPTTSEMSEITLENTARNTGQPRSMFCSSCSSSLSSTSLSSSPPSLSPADPSAPPPPSSPATPTPAPAPTATAAVTPTPTSTPTLPHHAVLDYPHVPPTPTLGFPPGPRSFAYRKALCDGRRKHIQEHVIPSFRDNQSILIPPDELALARRRAAATAAAEIAGAVAAAATAAYEDVFVAAAEAAAAAAPRHSSPPPPLENISDEYGRWPPPPSPAVAAAADDDDSSESEADDDAMDEDATDDDAMDDDFMSDDAMDEEAAAYADFRRRYEAGELEGIGIAFGSPRTNNAFDQETPVFHIWRMLA